MGMRMTHVTRSQPHTGRCLINFPHIYWMSIFNISGSSFLCFHLSLLCSPRTYNPSTWVLHSSCSRSLFVNPNLSVCFSVGFKMSSMYDDMAFCMVSFWVITACIINGATLSPQTGETIPSLIWFPVLNGHSDLITETVGRPCIDPVQRHD